MRYEQPGKSASEEQTRSAARTPGTTHAAGGSAFSLPQGGPAMPFDSRSLAMLQKSAGNAAVLQMMKAGVIQMKPVEDPRHPGFMQDDKYNKLKLKPIEAAEDGETAIYEIRNQMKLLYWKKETEDHYYEDKEHTARFEPDKAVSDATPFGSWMETYREARKAQQEIDDNESITDPQEKQRLKDAISMYLLQKFISNALFRSEEIERMDYQASPLNYQTNSQYLRSFATSFVSALQKTLPDGYPSSRLVLTRTDEMREVLGQFFQVMKAELETDINLDNMKRDLETTIGKTADYLLSTNKDLNGYWKVSGNPQAFVDITSLLEGSVQEQVALSERLGTFVRQTFMKAVAAKMAEAKVDALSMDGEQKETLRNEVIDKLNRHLDIETSDEGKSLSELLDKLGDSNTKPSKLISDYHGNEYMSAYKIWLHDKIENGDPKDFSKNEKNFVKASAEREQAFFQNIIKDEHFKQFLMERKEGRQIKEEDFAEPVRDEAWTIFGELKNRVSGAFATSNMVVVTGGVLKLKDGEDRYEQPAILSDDKAMGMAIKTAVNKSGNVPSPTEAGRKLFKSRQLGEIAESIIGSQLEKAPKGDKNRLEELRREITRFDPGTYTSLAQAEDQLEKTKEAFEKFKIAYKEDTSVLSVEARAAIKLLENSGALEDESPLPRFILKQLQQQLEDALVSGQVIEDYVRNIQGIHETCIFALEWSGRTPEPSFDYGAPQYKEPDSEQDEYFQGAHLTDYGLKAFSQAYDAVVAQLTANGRDTVNIEAFYNIYFELSDKLWATRHTSSQNKVSLQTPSSVGDYLNSDRFKEIHVEHAGPDLVLVDIHPNDATKEKIALNEVSELIEELFERNKTESNYDNFRCSVVVDITLNHTSEDEVATIRRKAHPYIKEGKLNLVFVQSLTKFAQLGMDKQSGGLLFAYNDAEKWGDFNRKLAELKNRDKVDPGIEMYFQTLFQHVSEEQVEYVMKVRQNTREMRAKLEQAFGQLKEGGAIQIAENTDEGTCYVALRYDEFLAQLEDLNHDDSAPLNLDTESDDEEDGRHKFNVDVLEQGINRLLSRTGLPVAMRFSFGFPVSNLGETGREIRFTIGLEGSEKLEEYADVLTYVSGKLKERLDHAKTTGEQKDELLTENARRAFLNEITQDIHSVEQLREKLRPLLKD